MVTIWHCDGRPWKPRKQGLPSPPERESKDLLALARTLHSQSGDAESVLWRHLRARRLTGDKFRRQLVIEPCIVDFVCLEARLIIEANGGQHRHQVACQAVELFPAGCFFPVAADRFHDVNDRICCMPGSTLRDDRDGYGWESSGTRRVNSIEAVDTWRSAFCTDIGNHAFFPVGMIDDLADYEVTLA